MCAINGITGENKELVIRMNEATKHRGPDGSRVWEGEGITLGHNRLSIIDLRDVASQPFVSEDGRFVIVYNGELYNFKDLKKELAHFSYKTEGDTEVLLNAYRTWGAACVKRFNGIFAFAIWDTKEKELFLARDQFGVKPLYYTEVGGQFIFSSEIKGILESDTLRVLDREAFSHYIRLLYTPGEQTLFRGIKKILPGHVLRVKDGHIEMTMYYAIPDVQVSEPKSQRKFHAQIREGLDNAVKQQLVADVPVGVYLSGGIDSTAIVDSVSRVHGSIDTFSIGFDLGEDEESEKFNADFKMAEVTASYYKTRHHGHLLKSNDIVSLIEESIWHMDEPVGNLTTLAQLKLAKYAKQDVSVVLGGDGGDELFGGYKRHGLARKLLPYWHLPKGLRACAPHQLRKANIDSWSTRYMLFLAQKDATLKRILAIPTEDSTDNFFRTHYFTDTTHATFLDDMMRADMNSWLVDESLLRSDKMSMACGLEERVPFLDNNLVALARTIPSAYKTTFFETKKILKDALKERLPAHVFNQPKRGWISPGAKWLRRPEVASYIKDVLSPAYYSETKNLFKWDEIEHMYAAHLEKREYHLTPLWSVIVFQIWARRFGVTIE
jgi:asparagine synthase (glutamine-hydrolysing)